MTFSLAQGMALLNVSSGGIELLRHIICILDWQKVCFFICLELHPHSMDYIYRVRNNSLAALADDGKFLLAARKCRKPTCTDYLISLDKVDMSKGSSTYIGKLRSAFEIWCRNTLKLLFLLAFIMIHITNALSLQVVSVKMSTVNSVFCHISFCGIYENYFVSFGLRKSLPSTVLKHYVK